MLICALFCLSLLTSSAHAIEIPQETLSQEEQIQLLIESTQASLEQLQQLKGHLNAFQKQEAVCIKDPENVQALYTLSLKALDLLNAIEQAQVEPYFRPAFLEELSKISKVAKKTHIPPLDR